MTPYQRPPQAPGAPQRGGTYDAQGNYTPNPNSTTSRYGFDPFAWQASRIADAMQSPQGGSSYGIPTATLDPSATTPASGLPPPIVPEGQATLAPPPVAGATTGNLPPAIVPIAQTTLAPPPVAAGTPTQQQIVQSAGRRGY